MVKNPPANAEDAGDRLHAWLGKMPWRGKWQPTPVFLPVESQGQRRLASYSPWGRKELDTAEWLNWTELNHWMASLVAQMVKNPPAVQEIQVWSLGWEDPMDKGMATHSSILACRIPGTEEPSGLQSMGSQRVRHDWATNAFTLNLWMESEYNVLPWIIIILSVFYSKGTMCGVTLALKIELILYSRSSSWEIWLGMSNSLNPL